MSRANEFLDKYNRLENLTEEKFDCGRYSPLIFLANTREFGKYATELNYCREVRNVISHNPRLDGSYIVEQAPKCLNFWISCSTSWNIPSVVCKSRSGLKEC